MKIGLPRINGKEVSREEFHRHGPVGGSGIPMCPKTYTEKNPMETTFDGVMEHQVPEMRRALKAHSIPGVEVRDDGSFRITSRAGRKRMHKEILGLFDKQGGFGDA